MDRWPWLLYLLLGVGFAALAVSYLVDGDIAGAVLLGLMTAIQFRAASRRRRGLSVSLGGSTGK
jgi:hypothetical protein